MGKELIAVYDALKSFFENPLFDLRRSITLDNGVENSMRDFRKFLPEDIRISPVDERLFAAAEQYDYTLRFKLCLYSDREVMRN